MNREEILTALKKLATCQGFYQRVLDAVQEDDTILDDLESQHFHDTVDLILWLEND